MMPLPPGQPERRASVASEALANSQRLTHHIKILGVILAIYVALAVTAASVIGVVNSIRSVEHAREGATYARQALDQATINTGIASHVEQLVAQQKPCLEGDPPDSPGCVRKAQSDKIVADAITDIKISLASNLETHDINAKNAHDLLLAQRNKIAPTRVPITSPQRKSTASKATTTQATMQPARPAPVAPVTTTTCPKRGKSDKCR